MVALVTASSGGSPSAPESQRPVHFSGLSGFNLLDPTVVRTLDASYRRP
jgi:hypothetical protein